MGISCRSSIGRRRFASTAGPTSTSRPTTRRRRSSSRRSCCRDRRTSASVLQARRAPRQRSVVVAPVLAGNAHRPGHRHRARRRRRSRQRQRDALLGIVNGAGEHRRAERQDRRTDGCGREARHERRLARVAVERRRPRTAVDRPRPVHRRRPAAARYDRLVACVADESRLVPLRDVERAHRIPSGYCLRCRASDRS